ncbi:MAG: response regulator [Deltaproteobacteria bacterium]|nr:response regulator [Deltaproteobacteria bacterium]
MSGQYLNGKKVLIVDDEPDVLETLKELLTMSKIDTASNFKEAKEKMESQPFDIAILDIMGVDGYKLLDIAKQKDVIAVMLTAHAFNMENTIRSFKQGAALYIPKEKMADITIYLNDVLEAKEKDKNTWWRWMDRFADFYAKKFTPKWQDKDKKFWEKFPYYY